MNRKIKVLIVDDQRRSLKSLQALLATWPAAAGIREAANGVEALRLAEEYRPDAVILKRWRIPHGKFLPVLSSGHIRKFTGFILQAALSCMA